MKNFKLVKAVILFFLWHSAVAQEVPKIRINPAQAYGGSVSDYFENVEYIPLETSKESLFGEINQMIITDENIVVYDIDTKAILFFTIGGKYIRKIKVGDNNNVLLTNNKEGNITVSMSKNIREGSNLVESIYSSAGLKIKQTNPNSFEDGLLKLNDGYFLGFGSCSFNKNENPKDSIYHLIKIYKRDTLYKSLLPYNQKLRAGFCKIGGGAYVNARGLRITDNSIFVSTPYEHLVYKVNKDTAIKMLQFVFPAERSISANILNSDNVKILDSVAQEVNRGSSKLIHDVRNIVYYKNKILFKITPNSYIRVPGSVSTQQYNFIYDTLTTKLVSMERLTPDVNNYFLPIIGNGSMVVFDGLYFHKGAYYTPISSLEMFTAQLATKNKKPHYPPVLQNYFTTQTRKSNPVIVRMKLKE